MNPPRFLIWNIHERAWRMECQLGYIQNQKLATIYELPLALEIVSQSNFRSGNVPNEAMVPEPKETL